MEVIPVPFEELNNNIKQETSAEIRKRVIKARKIQDERFKDNPKIHNNADMGPKEIKKYTSLGKDSLALLKNAMEKLNLSARAYTRILKVSRTIADLDNSEHIKINHIAEAINYRALDNEHWGEQIY